jgi:hypothetical protein
MKHTRFIIATAMLIIINIVSTIDLKSQRYPFSPTDEQHKIVGTVGEERGGRTYVI